METENQVNALARRVRWAREREELTQADLSEKLGFKDRQTLSAIEAGQRKIAAEELVRLIEVTGGSFDFFTDPLRLVGEGRFSFRARNVSEATLDAFEENAGRWIAAWRELGRMQKVSASPLRPRLMLDVDSTFEQAQVAGEALVQEWALGDCPALHLAEAVEARLGVLVLLVQTPAGVSGAACQLPPYDAILVNREEPEGRRNYDIAHEVFHVLTWDTLPPRRVDRENPSGYKDKRTEQLADNFAGALLMPADVIRKRWDSRPADLDLHEWLNATAEALRVTSQALKWRLVAMGLLSKPDLLEINDERLTWNGGVIGEDRNPSPAFSRTFISRIGRAIERGDLSVRRTVELLGASGTGGLKELFRTHGLEVPFDL